MAKTLPITVMNGNPRVVLDKPARNRLDAAIGVCAQIMMGEQTTPNALNAKAAIRGMQAILRSEDAVVLEERHDDEDCEA